MRLALALAMIPMDFVLAVSKWEGCVFHVCVGAQRAAECYE